MSTSRVAHDPSVADYRATSRASRREERIGQTGTPPAI